MKRRSELMTRLAALLAAPSVFASTALMAQTLKITSPPDGTVVKPGETITVSVTVSGGTVPDVVFAVEDLYHGVLMAPPYRFSVKIPSSVSLRRYVVSAVFFGKGDEGGSTHIFIDVERPDAPVKLMVTPPLLICEVGECGYLSAQATYADGTVADVHESTLTKWSSDSPSVLGVTDVGHVNAVGAGSAKITVENGGQTVVVPVTVTDPRHAVDPRP